MPRGRGGRGEEDGGRKGEGVGGEHTRRVGWCPASVSSTALRGWERRGEERRGEVDEAEAEAEASDVQSLWDYFIMVDVVVVFITNQLL